MDDDIKNLTLLSSFTDKNGLTIGVACSEKYGYCQIVLLEPIGEKGALEITKTISPELTYADVATMTTGFTDFLFRMEEKAVNNEEAAS